MKIFVSYSSYDRTRIEELVADLKNMDHRVWYDQELEGGQKWWDNILDVIRACDVLVFALTEKSLGSYPCKLEYSYADALGKSIVPVQLEHGINLSLLPVVLGERQIVNYLQSDKSAFINLSKALQRLPETPPLPQPLPMPPEIPISPLANLQSLIDERNLTDEQQAHVIHEIKKYYNKHEHAKAAHELLVRFSQHPSLRASILREIEAMLALQGSEAAPNQNVAPNIGSGKGTGGASANVALDSTEQILRANEPAMRLMAGGLGGSEGTLTITNHRIVFSGKKAGGLLSETIEIPLNQIAEVKKAFAALNVSPTIQILTKSGKSYSFIKYRNRDEVVTLIQGLIR